MSTHEITGDGLCNYSCTDCDWRYAHVGWGDPDDVARNRWVEVHTMTAESAMDAKIRSLPVPSLVLLDITEATADVLTAARVWAAWPEDDSHGDYLEMRLRDAIDRFNEATHESDARLDGAS